MIDLSELKVGDLCELANGLTMVVKNCYLEKTAGDVRIYLVDNDPYLQTGHSVSSYRVDIVKIIPKESELIKRNINGVNVEVHSSDDVRIVSVDKPKRFVDLLASGEEFIKDSQGRIWKQGLTFPEFFSHLGNGWVVSPSEFVIKLFQPATPAQNPDKTTKVVYQVLCRRNKAFVIADGKFTSKEHFKEQCPRGEFVRLIEESREEVEG